MRKVRRSFPRLVTQMLDDDSAIKPYMALFSICSGIGNKDHIDQLLQELHLLQFSSINRDDEEAKQMCDLAQIALGNTIDRLKKTGKIGVTGEERKALEVTIEYSRDYWARKSGAERDACVTAVNQWYADIERERKSA